MLFANIANAIQRPKMSASYSISLLVARNADRSVRVMTTSCGDRSITLAPMPDFWADSSVFNCHHLFGSSCSIVELSSVTK